MSWDTIHRVMDDAYSEQLRVQIETPIFATAEQREWVLRRTHRLFVGDWNMLVAPRFTRVERWVDRQRDRLRAVRAAWKNPDGWACD